MLLWYSIQKLQHLNLPQDSDSHHRHLQEDILRSATTVVLQDMHGKTAGSDWDYAWLVGLTDIKLVNALYDVLHLHAVGTIPSSVNHHPDSQTAIHRPLDRLEGDRALRDNKCRALVVLNHMIVYHKIRD